MSRDSFPLLPTPTSQDDGKTPEQHMAMKHRMGRNGITSLAVLARAGFENPGFSSTPAIPASRSPRQAEGSESKTLGTCGPTSSQPFAHYTPGSSYWRTSGGIWDSDLDESSMTLPAWGSMRNGELYERVMSGLRTSGHGCSSSPVLPSPNASDGPKGGPNRRDGKGAAYLSGIQRLLPTPGANDMTGGEGLTREARQENGTGGPALRDIGHLLPTPQAADGHGGRIDSRETVVSGKRPSGAKASVSVREAVTYLLPGASTTPRLDGGSTPSDDPHPGQLTIGED